MSYGKPVTIMLLISSEVFETAIREPFKNAPFPFSAVKSSFALGSYTTPAIISPLYSSPMETQKIGSA